MKNAGDASFNIELFEYGYLVEDTDPCATSMKVYVPKLSGTKTPSAEASPQSVDDSMIGNSKDSTLQNSKNVSTQSFITARVAMNVAHRHKFHDCTPQAANCPNATHSAFTCHSGTSCLKPCPHFHHDHHFPHVDDKGKIPKGSRVILLFMNHDINDAIVTRLECKFPEGAKYPDPPNEHR